MGKGNKGGRVRECGDGDGEDGEGSGGDGDGVDGERGGCYVHYRCMPDLGGEDGIQIKVDDGMTISGSTYVMSGT